MSEIKTISLKDKGYPRLLKKISNPPKLLYYKGTLPKAKEICFSIVGTRKYTSYGKEIALEIAADLSQAGLTIVSGFAPGIDTFVHQAVIKRRAKTIAVLGTGLNEKSIYPKSNLKLIPEILNSGGCLISEFPPNTPGSKITFPQRNRIISGLSWGVLVIEAKIKSGALITANFAFSQKRKVFAIPGSVYSLYSQGPHQLIKKGAKLVEKANDILKELNLSLEKKLSLDEAKNREEALILKILKEGELEIDKIIAKTKLPPAKVASALAILEIKGKVKNLGGNIFALSHS